MRKSWWIFLVIVLAAAGCDVIAPSPTPTLPPRAEEGKKVFQEICARCHSVTIDEIIVGPSLAGIATRGETRIPGMDAETYIRNSILDPGAYTVEGFPEGLMPPDIIDSLTVGDFEAVVDYLMTLR